MKRWFRELSNAGFKILNNKTSKGHLLIVQDGVRLYCASTPKNMEDSLAAVKRDFRRKKAKRRHDAYSK